MDGGHQSKVAQYSAKRLVLCIIRICIILCINTDNTWASTSMYLRDTWGQWLPLPRRRSRLPRSCRPCSRPRCWPAGPGRAAGRAAGRPIRGSAAGQQAGRSVMFCPRCWRVVGVHTVCIVHGAGVVLFQYRSARLVLCIIRIFIYYLLVRKVIKGTTVCTYPRDMQTPPTAPRGRRGPPLVPAGRWFHPFDVRAALAALS